MIFLYLIKFKLYLSLYANSEKNRQIKYWLVVFLLAQIYVSIFMTFYTVIRTSGSSLLANEKFLRLPQFCCFIWKYSESSPIICSSYSSDSIDLYLLTTLYMIGRFSYIILGLGKSPASSTEVIIWFAKWFLLLLSWKHL